MKKGEKMSNKGKGMVSNMDKANIPTLVIMLTLLSALFFLPIASAVEYPTLIGHVTDNAGIINAEYMQKITALAEHIEKNTTAEIAVLTVKSLEGEDKVEYAIEVGQKNGVGKKDVSNGLLILIAMDDGQGNGRGAYFVATGYGLESTLPDAAVNRINDQVLLPYLKKGKETKDITYYGQGIYEEMIVFEGLLTNNSEIVSKYGASSSSGGDGVWIIITIFIVVFIVLLVVGLASDGGGSSGGGSYGGGWSGGGGSDSGGGDSGGGGFGGGGFGGGGAGGGFRGAAGTAAATTAAVATTAIVTKRITDDEKSYDNKETSDDKEDEEEKERLRKKKKKQEEEEEERRRKSSYSSSYSSSHHSSFGGGFSGGGHSGGFGGGGFGGGGAGGRF